MADGADRPGPRPVPRRGPVFGGAERAAVDRYTRRVRWMKRLLPVAAAALVGAIFVAGRGPEEPVGLLSAEEMARLSAGLRLDNPRIAGRTDGGEPYFLAARTAAPDGPVPDRIALDAPAGEITLSDGRLLEGRAESGLLLREAGRMTFEGSVVIESSDGYRFRSERLEVLLKSREAESPGPVAGDGPRGSIEAGRMEVLSDPAAAGASRILFHDGVRVVFIPEGAAERGDPRAAGPSVEDER